MVAECKLDEDCVAPGVLGACEEAKCDNGACVVAQAANGTACDDGDACTTGDACQDGACTGDNTCTCNADADCDDNNVCTDDTCVAGACVQSTNNGPCNDGDACTDKDTCADGACAGAAISCDDGNPCTDDSCDSALGCVNAANANNCDDGNKCFDGGKCKDGQCDGGNEVVCDDGNPCTDDTCDPATGTCLFSTNEAACDDGDACTEGDVCNGKGQCGAGQPKACDDGNPCTDDSCGADGKCVTAPNDGGCDDGNPCTEGDTCQDGACVGGAAKACDDGNPCTDDACDQDAGCTSTNNSAPCTPDAGCTAGVCAEGSCKASDAKGCDDGNPCTTDSCDSNANKCVFAPVKDGASCGDGDKCAGEPTCQAGVCDAGEPAACDDGNDCTDDSCDPALGCLFSPNKSPCDDGDVCTEGDGCDGKTGKCAAGTPVDPAVKCDDGNPCTDDACDPVDGCLNTPNDASCDDGDVCTADDKCADGKCAGDGNGGCDDGNPCTDDVCNPDTGACAFAGNTEPCDDGDACTVDDACKNGQCAKGLPKCNDGDECTNDSCDAATGDCKVAPVDDGTKCDDGDLCTTGDACLAGKCTAPKDGLKCDDGNACTDDACDPATGQCSTSNNEAPCDTGDLCTFGDKCDGQGTCVAGQGAVCDDGNDCTTDSCDAATGDCKYEAVADGTVCDDGVPCTTETKCQAGSCEVLQSDCAIWEEAMDCGENLGQAGWTFNAGQGATVTWNVDQTPNVAALSALGCTLNLNDGVDYCQPSGFGGSCAAPTANVITPVIDASAATTPLVLTFKSYFQLDGPDGGTGNNGGDFGSATADRPRIDILPENGDQVIDSILLNKDPDDCEANQEVVDEGETCQQTLQNVQIELPDDTVGAKFRLRLRIHNPTTGGNQGAGWFVDDMKVDLLIEDEVCDDGIDNDLNGKTDCADAACKGNDACAEVCDDGVDNDFDDKVDCADDDCSATLICNSKVVYGTNFDCDEKGWTFVGAGNNGGAKSGAIWAIDGTPASVGPVSPQCSLNFNDGSNYCGNDNCQNSSSGQFANGGFATSPELDAAGAKDLIVNFKFGAWVEGPGNGGSAYDRIHLQVSTQDFQGCSSNTTALSNNAMVCNNSSTRTYEVSKSGAYDEWADRSIALDELFDGQKFKLRFRFATGDGFSNDHEGPHVDDLEVIGLKASAPSPLPAPNP